MTLCFEWRTGCGVAQQLLVAFAGTAERRGVRKLGAVEELPASCRASAEVLGSAGGRILVFRRDEAETTEMDSRGSEAVATPEAQAYT